MFATLFLYVCGLLDVPFIDVDIKLDGKLDDPWYVRKSQMKLQPSWVITL